jgi:hypothetical protein
MSYRKDLINQVLTISLRTYKNPPSNNPSSSCGEAGMPILPSYFLGAVGEQSRIHAYPIIDTQPLC